MAPLCTAGGFAWKQLLCVHDVPLLAASCAPSMLDARSGADNTVLTPVCCRCATAMVSFYSLWCPHNW